MKYSDKVSIPSLLCCHLLVAAMVNAASADWRSEADSIRETAKQAQEISNKLRDEIRAWKNRGLGNLSGAQQVAWSLDMAELNAGYQALLAFSDRYESARKLSNEEFAKRYDQNGDGNQTTTKGIGRGHLLIALLETDRALYSFIGSLRSEVGESSVIRNRLNEGNRSFGIQYGIFEEMADTYFDPQRRLRTRGRFIQLKNDKKLLERLEAEAPELYRAAQDLLQDNVLLDIASTTDVGALAASSWAALATISDVTGDMLVRTFHNASQFFGNLVGTNVFRVASLLGLGESRGHNQPAFTRYYSHSGSDEVVHPAKASDIEAALQAGDVIFDKTRFAITDKFIPGYFGHVAIYLRDYETLKQLGVFATDVMKRATNGMSAETLESHLEDYANEIESLQDMEEWQRLSIMRQRVYDKNFNGQPLKPLLFEALYRLRHHGDNVVEGLRDGQTIAPHEGGVTINRFEHFLYIDDFAAIRLKPRTDHEEEYRRKLARFLALALLQYGKPYDFRFDVNTTDAIVCSELIYTSFVDVEFITGKSLSSYTISPDQIAEQAGIKTTLGEKIFDPPFDLVQWYFDALPFFPVQASGSADSTASNNEYSSAQADSLVIRRFMATVREAIGGLDLLSPSERKAFAAVEENARRIREEESERLRHLPDSVAAPSMTVNRPQERQLQNLYAGLEKSIEKQRAAQQSEAEIAEARRETFADFSLTRLHAPEAAITEEIGLLQEDYEKWRRGVAYQPDYVYLYSGFQRFLLAIFRSGNLTTDKAMGRGFNLELAGNAEPPRRALSYIQHYSILPFSLQAWDNSGRLTDNFQWKVGLAKIFRRYRQGDYVDVEAFSWRDDAYAVSFRPLTLEAGGDKGPAVAILNLMTIGNGEYERGAYIGEMGRIEIAPLEMGADKRTLSLFNVYYGTKARLTLGDFRLYARGALGFRVGEFAERDKQSLAYDFAPIRVWAFGAELARTRLFRPMSHRFEFEVIEDDERFVKGRLEKDRQARLSYRWGEYY